MMSIELAKVEKYLKDLLEPEKFKDYCPNGLVVEGADVISKGIAGVSLTIELIEEAIKRDADMIFVHHPHGFWDKQLKVVRGTVRKKLALLLKHNISLFAFHLPLDAHLEVGNNAEIVRALGMEITGTFMKDYGTDIGILGECSEELDYSALITRIEQCIGPVIHSFNFGKSKVKNIAVCSGGAPNGIQEIGDAVGVYITGEAREHTISYCKEEQVNFIAAGHHATEVFGVSAVAKRLKNDLKIDIEFVNLPNPV